MASSSDRSVEAPSSMSNSAVKLIWSLLMVRRRSTNATLLPGRSSRRGSLHQLLVLLSLLDGGGAASLLRPDGHERRGLALAHPEKKDEPDDDRASEHQGCHAGAHQGFRKWGHHPQKGQRPPTARPFGTFRERVLRPVVRNVPLPLSP